MYSLTVQIRNKLNPFVGRVGFEPTTNGLKVRYSVNKRLTIQPLTGTLVATYAQLCTTVRN